MHSATASHNVSPVKQNDSPLYMHGGLGPILRKMFYLVYTLLIIKKATSLILYSQTRYNVSCIYYTGVHPTHSAKSRVVSSGVDSDPEQPHPPHTIVTYVYKTIKSAKVICHFIDLNTNKICHFIDSSQLQLASIQRGIQGAINLEVPLSVSVILTSSTPHLQINLTNCAQCLTMCINFCSAFNILNNILYKIVT